MPTEFQAIVLAGGRGSRFQDLTGEKFKCLLPIGPLPMIFYPLHMLCRYGFQEIIVVVMESERSEIQQTLERLPVKAKLDFVTVPSDLGTAEALKHIYDRYVFNLTITTYTYVYLNVTICHIINCCYLFCSTASNVIWLLYRAIRLRTLTYSQ